MMYPLAARNYLFVLLVALGAQLHAQSSVWDQLGKVTFDEVYVNRYENWLLKPNYSTTAKAICNKEITITGYLIPMEPKKGIYALSKYPFASCFFCGGAGPETVIQLQLSPQLNLAVDTFVTIKGVLHCAQDASLDLPYSMPKSTLHLP